MSPRSATDVFRWRHLRPASATGAAGIPEVHGHSRPACSTSSAARANAGDAVRDAGDPGGAGRGQAPVGAADDRNYAGEAEQGHPVRAREEKSFGGILPVPEGVGGRFCVASPVGLLPLAVAATGDPAERVNAALAGLRRGTSGCWRRVFTPTTSPSAWRAGCSMPRRSARLPACCSTTTRPAGCWATGWFSFTRNHPGARGGLERDWREGANEKSLAAQRRHQRAAGQYRPVRALEDLGMG